MKISKPVKIIIGLLTAWVVITPILAFGAWFFFIFSIAASPSTSQLNPNTSSLVIFPIIAVIICTSLLNIIMQAFYLVHIILNKTGTDLYRAIFGVGMIFIAILAMPVYYFIYVLPDNPPQWALIQNPLPAGSPGQGSDSMASPNQ